MTGGGDSAYLKAQLETAMRGDVSGIVSFGIAGGLAPGVRPGTPLVARGIVAEDAEYFECHRGWSQRLAKALGDVPIVDMAGIDLPVTDPCRKTGAPRSDPRRRRRYGVAYRGARRRRASSAICRIPSRGRSGGAAIAARGPRRGCAATANVAVGRVMRSVLSEPRQIPHLFRTALDAKAAFDALFRGRQMVAGGFGFLDFGELMLDVPCEDVLGGSLPV